MLISAIPTSCPVCHASNTRRSRRRTVLDYLFSIAGILPRRCETCETRFHAPSIPFRTMLYAHCEICGNFALQSISAERMQGVAGTLGRIFGLPALRCEPCRHKFFSLRPLQREEHPVTTAQSN